MKSNEINKKKLSQAINFIEELSWLFDSKKNLDWREVPLILKELMYNDVRATISSKYVSPNNNKNYLIGVLPSLFQDEELFPTNFDLVEFAKTVLKIKVSRADKRSKYELIGLIVCEVINLNESPLTELVDALSNITNSNEKLKQIRRSRDGANFSWNEAIKLLNLY